MAPKKDDKKKGKKGAEEVNEGLFVPREPDEPVEHEVEATAPPDESLWEGSLPLWNEEEIAEEPWNPADVENIFVDGDFDREALPPVLKAHCVGWKRAPGTAKTSPLDTETKVETKFEPGPGISAFEELPATNKCVVTNDEFTSGVSELIFEDSKPPFIQYMLSQFALIFDQPRIFESGCLWNKIYPQVEGKPVYNPNGKYIVKLLVNGHWRKIEVDDLVPVMATGGQLHPHAPLMPSKQGSGGPGPIWPMILTKALLKAFHPYCVNGMHFDIPVLHAVTGFIPQRKLFQWSEITDQEAQPVKVVHLGTHTDTPEPPKIPLKADKKKVVHKAVLPFLVAEVCPEPPQLRLKALQARPAGFMEAKATIATVQTPPAEEEEDSEFGESYEEEEEEDGGEYDEEEHDEEDDEPMDGDEEKAAEEEVELVDGGYWALWDDEAFYGERPVDFEVYYSPDEFITTLHDTTELGIVAPEKREMKLLQVTLPPPLNPPAEEGQADEPQTVGVGFWYQGTIGPSIPKMDITLVSPWMNQAAPADLPNVDTSTAPLVQLEGTTGSFARVFQLEPGAHTFALEENAIGGGVLHILVEKPPAPPALTEEEIAEKEAAGETVDEPPEIPQPVVTLWTRRR
jgi:hypothetical protein